MHRVHPAPPVSFSGGTRGHVPSHSGTTESRYAAVSGDRCFWVGQTQNLRSRIISHMRTSYRRDRWLYAGAMMLKPDTPAAIVNRLETETARRLRPVDGKAWPQIA